MAVPEQQHTSPAKDIDAEASLPSRGCIHLKVKTCYGYISLDASDQVTKKYAIQVLTAIKAKNGEPVAVAINKRLRILDSANNEVTRDITGMTFELENSGKRIKVASLTDTNGKTITSPEMLLEQEAVSQVSSELSTTETVSLKADDTAILNSNRGLPAVDSTPDTGKTLSFQEQLKLHNKEKAADDSAGAADDMLKKMRRNKF